MSPTVAERREPIPLNGVDTPKLQAIVEQSRARSAVFDVLTNGDLGPLIEPTEPATLGEFVIPRSGLFVVVGGVGPTPHFIS